MRFDGTALRKTWESSAIAPSAIKAFLVFGFLALCALVFSGGSLLRIWLAVLIVFLPIAVSLAIKCPLIFPFAAYVTVVPLNDVLASNQFGTLSKLAGAASLIAAAFWLVRTRVMVKAPLTIVAWLVLAVWMTMGGMWALNRADWLGNLTPGAGAYGLLTFMELFCLYAILAVMPVRAFDWKTIQFGIVFGGVVAAGLSLYDAFHVGSFYGHRLWMSTTSGDVVGPNHFAGALLLPVFVTASVALSERSWLSKIALGLCLCTLMAGIFLSGSRDAVLAVALGFSYLLWRTRYRAQLSLLIIAVALVAVPHISDLVARFSLIASENSDGAGRIFIWRIGWHAFKDHWLAGVGLQNFPHAFDQAYLQVYARVPTGWGYAGHNLFLTSAVELGIFGVGLLLLAWLAQFFMLRLIPRTNPLYDSRLALESAMLALFVSSIFVNDIMYEKYAWMTFCVMAILRSRYIVSSNEGAAYRNGITDQPRSRTRLDEHSRQLRFRRDARYKVPLP